MSDIREAFEALIKYRKAYDEMYQMLGMFLDAEEGLEKPDIDQAWSAFNQAPGPVYWERIEAALQQTAHAADGGEVEQLQEELAEMKRLFGTAMEVADFPDAHPAKPRNVVQAEALEKFANDMKGLAERNRNLKAAGGVFVASQEAEAKAKRLRGNGGDES